ncbi:hypothetical protein AB0K48_45935 [Nonomuraea sp. NPDC055795]
MQVNASIPSAVWHSFDALPSQTLPRKAAKPVKRLTALAQALSRDGFRSNARKDAYAELFGVLDGFMARHRQKMDEAILNILEVQGESIVAGVNTKRVSVGDRFVEIADDRVIEADFRAAGRVFSLDIARKYAEHVAVPVDDDDGLLNAHLRVAALAQIEGVQVELDREAESLSKEWLAKYRVGIKGLSDERRAVYDDIIGTHEEPQRIDIRRPRIRTEDTIVSDGMKLPTAPGHLLCDENGEFPINSLNLWERRVLQSEMAQPGFRAWYRNPGRASDDSLAIAYKNARGNWCRLCPDFIFFHGDDSDIKVSIVDPHGFHLNDALPKLRGLGEFADKYGAEFHRIEAVAEMEDGTLRVLDVMEDAVRLAIDIAADAEMLYLSEVAIDYVGPP